MRQNHFSLSPENMYTYAVLKIFQGASQYSSFKAVLLFYVNVGDIPRFKNTKRLKMMR